MEKYSNDFPCEFNPRLKAKIDYFLDKCSVLDGKDTGLYALANDVLEEEIKSFFYDDNEKHGYVVYSKLLQDNSFRKYIKSAGIDCAFLDRIYMLENSPYDFFPTDSFLEKETLIEGVFNTLKSIYNRKSPEAKVDCISEEKVKPVIMRDDSACCKTEEADTSPSTPDMHFPDDFSQDELFQSSIGVDAIEQSDDDIEKIITKSEKKESRNQETLETNAQNQLSNESLILKCQNVISRMFKEEGITDLGHCGKESCERIINALDLILPKGLTIKSSRSRKKNKIFYTLKSIDLNYLKVSCSVLKDNYKKVVRGFISWILSKPLNKKKEEVDISPSTPDMHFPDDFSQDELFQSSIGVDAIEQSDDDIEKIITKSEKKESRNQVTLETNAESQLSNMSLILKCQNTIFRMLKEDGKTDLGQCDKESCEKLINALILILPNGLTLIKKKRRCKLESIDLNYSKKYCSKTKDNYLNALRGFLSWLLRNPSDEKTDSQASQNDIKDLQTFKYYEAISRIIIAKFGENYFFYMEGNTPRLKQQIKRRINEFKELIFKLNEDEELKNRIHIEFSIGIYFSYIRIQELGLYLQTQQYSNSSFKKKENQIGDLIWRFYKLVLQKSNYCPSAMLNRQ